MGLLKWSSLQLESSAELISTLTSFWCWGSAHCRSLTIVPALLHFQTQLKYVSWSYFPSSLTRSALNSNIKETLITCSGVYPIVVINCKALPVAYISVCDKRCSRGNLDRGIVFCLSQVNVGVITVFITWEVAVGVMKKLFSIFKR